MSSPMIFEKSRQLDERSKLLRQSVLKMMTGAGRGHLPSAFSLVEILRVLYDDILHVDPLNPRCLDRDRCILSKGHGCMALYAILADKGFFSPIELDKFCRPDALLGGHPECKIPGVEASTGSLGHGLSIGVGFALNAIYEKADYRTYVVLGDGECNEGSIWEAAMCAAKHKLCNLTAIIDYNKHQSYGPINEVQELEPFGDKWRAFGFEAVEVDGHDINALTGLFKKLPLNHSKPTAVICHTIKGKGIAAIENDLSWHHKSKITEQQINMLETGLENYR